MKTIGIKCDECGKYFLPGSRKDGTPNGVGLVKEDGSIHNVCADCLDKIGEKILPMTTEDHMMAFIRAYDKKIRELMTEEEYKKFSEETAKQILLAEIMASPDEEFKNFCLENFNNLMNGAEGEKGEEGEHGTKN